MHDSSPAVLLVDDHAQNLLALEAALEPLVTEDGVRVLRATSADDALRHALAEGEHLAVVLLDVMMPGTDGPETARLLRQRAQTADVPIVFVTALDADHRRLAAAYASGAVDYLTKPVDAHLLRAKVGAFVDLHRRREEARRQERRRFADQAQRAAERAAAAVASAHAESAAALRDSEARLASIVASAMDAIVTTDETRRIVVFNAAAERMFGVPAHEAVGSTLDRFLPPQARESHAAQIRAFGETGATTRDHARAPRPVVAVRADGTEFPVEATISQVVVGGRRLYTAVLRDVTERVAAELERERLLRAAETARAAADEANRAKSDFLARMSHELRTPLNAIGGHLQLIEMELHGPVTPAQREALARVARAQQHLLGLINDVLNFARLESGRVEFALRPYRLASVLADVRPMVEPQLAAKRLEFHCAADDDAAEVLVWADREKLVQVLLNLLSNAIKFTSEGGRVAIELAPDADDPAYAVIRVVDDGVGIPADRLGVVFDPFVQVHPGLTRTQQGVGLGLAISRDLARGMGGELTAASVEGAGSTFSLRLRRAVGSDGTPTDRRNRTQRRAGGERRKEDGRA